MPVIDIEQTEWVRLIRAEYLEFPGLSLTLSQAQRLWDLKPEFCEAVLEGMVRGQFLRRTPRDRYVRADDY